MLRFINSCEVSKKNRLFFVRYFPIIFPLESVDWIGLYPSSFTGELVSVDRITVHSNRHDESHAYTARID
jgi:hypothetical protein